MAGNLVHLTDDIRQMCEHPLQEEGRYDLRDKGGKLVVNQTFGIKKKFRPDYPYPVVKTSFDSYLDMVDAVADDDQVRAVEAVKRIQNEVISIDIPYEGRSDMKKEVSITEYAFFGQVNLQELARNSGRKLVLLNPSPGTITRCNRVNIRAAVAFVFGDGQDNFKKEVKERMAAEKYIVEVYEYGNYLELSPDHLYYCGMSADHAYHNGVKNFVGMSLDPYAHIAAGKAFETAVKMPWGKYFEYVRSNYIAKLYHYDNPGCDRYAVDVVTNVLSLHPKVKHERSVSQWSVMSSEDLKWKGLYKKEIVPPAIDVQRYYAESVELVATDKIEWYKATLAGEDYVLDVVSPYMRPARDFLRYEIATKVGLQVLPATNSKAYNYERHIAISSLVELGGSLIEVEPMKKLKTKCVTYEYVHKGVIDTETILFDNKLIIPKEYEPVQRCEFVTVSGVWYIAPNKGSSKLYRIDATPGKHHNAYDFLSRKCKKVHANIPINCRALDLFSTTGVFAKGPDIELNGFFPRHGVPSHYPEFHNGNVGYRRGIGVFLKEMKGGNVVSDKGKRYVVQFNKTYMPRVSLMEVASRETSLSRNTYMLLTGKQHITARYVIAVDLSDGDTRSHIDDI